MNEIRTVFMGSPEFALTILQSLVGKVNLVGVVTQPDRPAGRGKVLTAPPVKRLAQEIGIPVLQPERLRNPDSFAQLQAWQPDLIIVAAFTLTGILLCLNAPLYSAAAGPIESVRGFLRRAKAALMDFMSPFPELKGRLERKKGKKPFRPFPSSPKSRFLKT